MADLLPFTVHKVLGLANDFPVFQIDKGVLQLRCGGVERLSDLPPGETWEIEVLFTGVCVTQIATNTYDVLLKTSEGNVIAWGTYLVSGDGVFDDAFLYLQGHQAAEIWAEFLEDPNVKEILM